MLILNQGQVLLSTIVCLLFLDNVRAANDETTDKTTTQEPEGQIGCPPPDFKIRRARKHHFTTEQPYVVTFETTQIYLPQDFTTADLELIENSNANIDDNNNQNSQINQYANFKSTENHDDNNNNNNNHKSNGEHVVNYVADDVNSNPFWWEVGVHFDPAIEKTLQPSKKRRRNSNHHQKRSKIHKHHRLVKRDLLPITNNDVNNRFNTIDDVFFIESFDVLQNFLNENDSKPDDVNEDDDSGNWIMTRDVIDETVVSLDEMSDNARVDRPRNKTEELKRVKRKSGKTTGALSRAKAGSDTTSSKKSSNRHKHGEGQIEEEEGWIPGQGGLESEELEEIEEDEDSEDQIVTHMREVSEVRFPGEVGPLGDHRLCKIKCVKGKWIGPLCAISDQEDENGQIKFEPLYKRCVVDQIAPYSQLSYKNVSVTVGWDLPHGHTLQVRCTDLGLYKLLGESKVLCSNGLWAPRMPTCVPTTLLTNFSDDSPPSIRIKVGAGSAAYEPSGVLAVLPGSTLHLDCMYPRTRGSPEWTWTGWFRQYITGWSAMPDEKSSKYRLTIKDTQNTDSGTYTCSTSKGLTNSITIVVTTAYCNNIFEPNPPLQLRLEGNKLGQRAIYRCPLGFNLQGSVNATCLASGNWSSSPPTCHTIQCPPLMLEDPHISLVELNASAWGRAVFKCAWGYRLSGPNSLECEPDGRWSASIPRCRAVQCPQPLIPINGRIDGTNGLVQYGQKRYSVGALVTFSCTEGHTLIGEASIVCTETGFWSHPPPFCNAQCSYPGDPPNGLIAPLKFYYDPGDYLSVQCRPGFIEHNSKGMPERTKCLPDGNWSGPVPQCKNYEDV